MIKRLIFDIDGTLLYPIDWDKAMIETLKAYNIYSEENLKKFENTEIAYIEVSDYKRSRYLKFIEDALGKKLGDNFLNVYFKNLGKYAIPKNSEELVKTIDTLSKNYELVLLSNFFEESQRGRLKTIGINQYFPEYYGETISKPHKEAFMQAIGNHDKSECVMIGDDPYFDIKGANDCGIKTIWINSRKLQQTEIPTKTIDSIVEINPELIESLDNNLQTATV